MKILVILTLLCVNSVACTTLDEARFQHRASEEVEKTREMANSISNENATICWEAKTESNLPFVGTQFNFTAKGIEIPQRADVNSLTPELLQQIEMVICP